LLAEQLEAAAKVARLEVSGVRRLRVAEQLQRGARLEVMSGARRPRGAFNSRKRRIA